MIEVRTEIGVAAPPDRVWRILTDFERYPDLTTLDAMHLGIQRRSHGSVPPLPLAVSPTGQITAPLAVQTTGLTPSPHRSAIAHTH
jgi:uncharacterized membrane protein